VSAGLLMYRKTPRGVEVLLVHPGGPFWRNKDQGAWTIPKGEVEEGEDLLAAARREFEEETGIRAREPFLPLESVKQKGGKTVYAWAFEGDCDPEAIRSNQFQMEWPKGSGKLQSFPEIDRAAFFRLDEAKLRINPAQASFLDELRLKLGL
jgi:predicted NUDIX family NTP pyrophosphohydrolase